MSRKWPELWLNDLILHHDNAPAHKALSHSFWHKNRLPKWNTHPIPLVWLQMTSGCFQTKGRRIQDIEDTRYVTTTALKAVPQQELPKCFQQWQHRREKCRAAQMEYFEGDPSH
jgi:primosomal protein N''